MWTSVRSFTTSENSFVDKISSSKIILNIFLLLVKNFVLPVAYTFETTFFLLIIFYNIWKIREIKQVKKGVVEKRPVFRFELDDILRITDVIGQRDTNKFIEPGKRET